MTDKNRLQELEIKISYLERTIEEISSAMIKQDRTIWGLNEKLNLLTDQIQGKQEEIGPIEKPPHY